MSQENQQGAVELPDPGVPADQGLSSLGLLMQLAGSVFGAYACLLTFTVLLVPRMEAQRGWMLLVLAACVARSLVHRAAGTQLLYAKHPSASPLSGVKRYILIALIQSAVVAAILIGKFQMPTKLGASFGVGLALWPVVLAVLLRLPRFRRFEDALPIPEDKGFEGASILMVVLGTCGVLASGAFLLLLLQAGDGLMRHGLGIMMLGAVITLVIRSMFHVQAGVSGLRETGIDRTIELANRYANFGVIAAFCTGAALLLITMMARFDIAMLAIVSGLCWMLLAWPLIIRRFFGDRQFAELLAGDHAAIHRRAPDAGLTSLGWLLFGHAIFSATFVVPQLAFGVGAFGDNRLTESLAMFGASGVRSIWWSVGLIVLQGWAGWELIRMSSRARPLASVFAIAAAIVSVFVMWPVLKTFTHGLRFAGPQALVSFIPLAIQLVIPVTTLILVNRKITPAATARFRPRPTPGSETPTGA